MYALAPTSAADGKITVHYIVYGLPGATIDNPIKATKEFTITPNITCEDDSDEIVAYGSLEYSLTNLLNNKLASGSDESVTYEYSYKIINNKETGLSDEEIALLTGSNLDKIKNLVSEVSGDNKITISPKAVASNKVVTLNVTMTPTQKSSSGVVNTLSNMEPFTATLTITIKPDCTVNIAYPTFGTNQTFDVYYISFNDDIPSGGLNLTGSGKINVTVSPNSNSNSKSATYELADNSYITLNGSIITKNEDASLTEDQPIEILVKVDNVTRGKINLLLKKDAVFTAKFDESGTSELSKDFAGTQSGTIFDSNGKVKIHFYYNGYEMTLGEYELALFKAQYLQAEGEEENEPFDVFDVEFDTNVGIDDPQTVEIKNSATNNTVATLTYTYVLDYTLTNYDEVAAGATSGTQNSSYAGDEFNQYVSGTKTVKVLKTIELTAGQNYELLNILQSAEIAIKNLAGEDFEDGNVNIDTIKLDYGKYTNNTGYADNISGLIAIQNIDNKNYNISPKGAEQGGNIVHLVVRLGYNSFKPNNSVVDYTDKDTYIIRIKINPSVTINAKSNGSLTVKYTDNTSQALTLVEAGSATLYNSEKVTNLPLSNIVTFSGIAASDLIVSVGEGARYVVGTGTNRLGTWTDSNNASITVYGIQLRKTILGGNTIKLTISDKYGYKVTSTITYLNENSVSPQIVKSPNSIYEGGSFRIAFQVGENVYNIYYWGKESESSADYKFLLDRDLSNPINAKEYTFAELPSDVIALSSFNVGALEGLITNAKLLKVEGGEATNLTIGGKTGIGVSNLTASFNNGSVFNGAITTTPEFNLTLKVLNPALGSGAEEVLILPFGTQLNQKYTIRAATPYSNYDALYFGLARNYKVQEVFEVYDNESGMVIAIDDSTTFDLTAFAANSPLTLSSNEFTTSSSITSLTNVANKVESESRSVTFNFNLKVNGMENAVTHSLNKAIYLTPTYFGLKYPTTYLSTYGQVLMGGADITTPFDWTTGITFVDYYNQPVEYNSNAVSLLNAINGTSGITQVSTNIASGTGSWGDNHTKLKGISPNSPITISVKSNNVEIGEVLVTLARYYGLTGVSANVQLNTATDILPFDNFISEIKALVVGGNGTSESIPTVVGSLFTFETADDFEIINIEGKYAVYKKTGNFGISDIISINVKYLGMYIGFIRITNSGVELINPQNGLRLITYKKELFNTQTSNSATKIVGLDEVGDELKATIYLNGTSSASASINLFDFKNENFSFEEGTQYQITATLKSGSVRFNSTNTSTAKYSQVVLDVIDNSGNRQSTGRTAGTHYCYTILGSGANAQSSVVNTLTISTNTSNDSFVPCGFELRFWGGQNPTTFTNAVFEIGIKKLA